MTKHEKMIKAALFRAQHRGGKEADIIIGGFTEVHVHSLTIDELQSLTELLCHDDHDILYWVEVIEAAPTTLSRSLLEKMNAFAFKVTALKHEQDAA
jgi:antitoxin CptB